MAAGPSSMTDPDTPTIGAELELVRAQPVLPMDVTAATQVMRAYQEICRAVLVDSDYQSVGNNRFVKRSGFQKLGATYGVSTELVSLDLDRDDDGQLTRAHAIVRATHPTGRHSDGDGACSTTEKRFRGAGGRDKLEHDLPATAVTRATNRAISNLVAFGQISAEEAGEDDRPASIGTPSWAQPTADVAETAGLLVDILNHAGVPDAADKVSAIGQAIFDAADNSLPKIVHLAFGQVHTAITTSIPVTAEESTS